MTLDSQDLFPRFRPRLSHEDEEVDALLPRICTESGGPLSSSSMLSVVEAAAFVLVPAMTPFIKALNWSPENETAETDRPSSSPP